MNKIRQKFAVGCSPNNHLIYGAVFRVTFKTLRCFSHFSTQSHRTGTWVDNAYTHWYKYTHNELYLHIQMYRAHTHIYKLHHYRITSVNLHVLCIYIYVCMYVCVLMCYIYKWKYIHIYIYVNITCYHLLQTFANINACIHSTRTRTHKNVYIYIHNQSYHILHEHSQCWMDNSCRMFTVAIWNNHSPYKKSPT